MQADALTLLQLDDGHRALLTAICSLRCVRRWSLDRIGGFRQCSPATAREDGSMSIGRAVVCSHPGCRTVTLYELCDRHEQSESANALENSEQSATVICPLPTDPISLHALTCNYRATA